MTSLARLLLGAALWTLALAAHGDERILSFHSAISVHASGEMTVQETLRVRAEGREIRRGIYRDFPTRYRDRLGHEYHVGFEVLEVRRDGRREPWHAQRLDNGVRVYIGDKDVLLRKGEYAYTLTYRTNRQLGFFADHDELYWNVTGNDWAFAMDEARATVRLPAGIPRERLQLEAYTGPQGARGRDFRVYVNEAGEIEFETTRALAPRHGLTVVVGWPKGHVQAPTREQRVRYWLRDNRGVAAALGGLALLLLYYTFVWWQLGRDPSPGAIVPQFAPPHGLSPAAMRYLRRMGYDNETFAAAILSMASKGYLTITGEGGRDGYTLSRRPGIEVSAGLNTREARVAQELFTSSNEIALDNSNHVRVGRAIEALKKGLAQEFHKVHFVTNRGWLVPGALLTLVAILASGTQAAAKYEEFLGMGLWLTIWTFGTTVLLVMRQYFMGFFFLLGELAGLWLFATEITSLGYTVMLAALLGMNVLFFFLLEAPTRSGRKLLDAIEGFRMYLSAAEQDRLNLMHPPEKTPELFERYLPYAVALDVEHEWADQFAEVLKRAGRAPADYRPSWYRGHHSSGLFGTRSLAGTIGASLATSVAAASQAPGSSSGFSGGGGGGGSSGGGGGGGGGGGW